MKINRLLEITLILLNQKTVTAEKLAARFGVSTRTIYRDIDALSLAGVPVYTNRGSGGGISLLENFALQRTLLTEHERDSLVLALQTLRATRYPDIDATLDKIGAVFKKTVSADWVQVEFSPWGSGPNAENKFLEIKRAILECRVADFDYTNAEGALSRRRIEPMRLVFKGQAWYVMGYCLTRRGFRMFRISRIKNLKVTEENFVRRPLEAFFREAAAQAPPRLVTLKLRFRTEDMHRLYDDYDDRCLTRYPDGTCDVSFTLPEDEWVYGYVLSFGPGVEVLEPPHVRRIVRERMQKALEFYRNDAD